MSDAAIMRLAEYAMLCVMRGGLPKSEPRPVRYDQFCGPPFPASRQHLRALQRQAEKVRQAFERGVVK